MYLPAKLRIRFLEPVDLSATAPRTPRTSPWSSGCRTGIRLRIQEELDDLLLARRSVWFG